MIIYTHFQLIKKGSQAEKVQETLVNTCEFLLLTLSMLFNSKTQVLQLVLYTPSFFLVKMAIVEF